MKSSNALQIPVSDDSYTTGCLSCQPALRRQRIAALKNRTRRSGCQSLRSVEQWHQSFFLAQGSVRCLCKHVFSLSLSPVMGFLTGLSVVKMLFSCRPQEDIQRPQSDFMPKGTQAQVASPQASARQQGLRQNILTLPLDHHSQSDSSGFSINRRCQPVTCSASGVLPK